TVSDEHQKIQGLQPFSHSTYTAYVSGGGDPGNVLFMNLKGMLQTMHSPLIDPENSDAYAQAPSSTTEDLRR
ncbi:hypothetical protein, partial [Pseudomonas sp. MWU12-2115]|uniref:hypothetical protein n=1 Tax=Pseudomonas sp. MWU12-2115 TaxID=2071713 RepID=UPI001C498223